MPSGRVEDGKRKVYIMQLYIRIIYTADDKSKTVLTDRAVNGSVLLFYALVVCLYVFYYLALWGIICTYNYNFINLCRICETIAKGGDHTSKLKVTL